MSMEVLTASGMLEVGTVEGQAHVEAASGPDAVRLLRSFVSGVNILSEVKIGLNATYVKDALRVMYTDNLMIEMNNIRSRSIYGRQSESHRDANQIIGGINDGR
jgi:hypothetical protein